MTVAIDVRRNAFSMRDNRDRAFCTDRYIDEQLR
jgi:hypothetical protein